MPERPYEKLVVWQEAYKLCLWIYKVTKKFPTDERFGLVSQMRRSSQSVTNNIAEANGRRSAKEKRHFFDIAQGSLEELHCQCRLFRDLGHMTKNDFI